MKFKDIRKNHLKVLSAIREIYDQLLQSREMDFFIYGEKEVVELGDISEEKESLKAKIIKNLLEVALKRKLYLYITKRGNKKNLSLISKRTLNIGDSISDRELGIILGFPKCCINKYCQELGTEEYSYNSSLRYIEQLKRYQIKNDPFDILLRHNSGGLGYGFVPCSPRCNNALNVKKKMDKIEKEINKNE